MYSYCQRRPAVGSNRLQLAVSAETAVHCTYCGRSMCWVCGHTRHSGHRSMDACWPRPRRSLPTAQSSSIGNSSKLQQLELAHLDTASMLESTSGRKSIIARGKQTGHIHNDQLTDAARRGRQPLPKVPVRDKQQKQHLQVTDTAQSTEAKAKAAPAG